MDELVGEFVAESRENLDCVEQELIELEKDPTQAARIATIFRAIHTIKGTCGFLELHNLETVAHAGENLLSILRDGTMAFTAEVATVLLELVDAIRNFVVSVEQTGKDGEQRHSSLVARLNALAAGEPLSASPAAAAPIAAEPAQGSVVAPAEEPATAPTKVPAQKKKRNYGKGRTDQLGSDVSPAAPPAPQPVKVQPPPPPVVEPVAVAVAPRRPPSAPPAEPPATAARQSTTIRVDVAVLDGIMNLVGELVLARNQLLELTSSQVRTPLALTCQRINQVTTDLQGSVMKTRMQPIATVWNKFPRVARELGVQCGKRVRVDLNGSETELDKTVLEAISEPLAHLIRNSVDHGIESPEKRAAAGKPVEGRVNLSASHQGGHVVIEIADDGAGINVERVKSKALEKGIVTETQLAKMSPQEVFRLIFAPGFSTAEKVTNISGRGVGMDVVRTNIERIGGSVDMHSELGKGTTCRVRLPLTLAIVPAIIVSSAGQRFAMPQLGLQELVRVRRNGQGIEHVHGAPVYRLRGRLLPLIWLTDVLDLRRTELSSKLSDCAGHILVLQVEGGTFGLVVDEVTNSEEIVVKPISDILSGINVYAGATILGDGQVALILDASNLVSRARVAQVKTHRAELDAPPAVQVTDLHSYVLCAAGGESRLAVPLDQVERLEKFQSTSIEARSGRAVLQYRGEIIPLFGLQDGCDSASDLRDLADGSGRIHTLVYREGKRRVGLVVSRIMDVVEHDARAIQHGNEAVIGERVTAIIDLREVAHRACPSLQGHEAIDQFEVAS